MPTRLMLIPTVLAISVNKFLSVPNPITMIKHVGLAIGIWLVVLTLLLTNIAYAQQTFELSSATISAGTGAGSSNDFNLTIGVLAGSSISGQMQSADFTIDSGLVARIYADDLDRDGFASGVDNCVDIANPDQADADNDLLGDVCDTDDDNDLILDALDNCPLLANADQLNTDGDDQGGDVCDPDADNDGVENPFDLDPLNESICQDLDGDMCDDCTNGADNFAPADNFFTDNDGLDTNANGICNLTDPDDDGDGVLDNVDNCPLIVNPEQLDENDNGVGDLCEVVDDSFCFPVVAPNGVVLICL